MASNPLWAWLAYRSQLPSVVVRNQAKGFSPERGLRESVPHAPGMPLRPL